MGRLLGRDGELAHLRRVVGETAAGRGALVLLEGDAGIGKTGLVREAASLAAAQGVVVLTARGAELEGELAFGVVRALLGRTAAGRSWPGAAALAGPVLTGDDAGQDLFATLHGLYWLVMEVSDRAPLLLVVDDAHWCDAPSLRFLAYLAHRLVDVPVSLLVAARPDVDPVRASLLGALAAESATGTLRPGPLGEEYVDLLVQESLGTPDPGFVAQVSTVTGGNPFLVCELLTELALRGVSPRADAVPRLADTVPREVERAVARRLARLGEAATTLAQAAAVLGDGVELRHAAAVAGLVPDDGAGPAADALARGRLVEHAARLTFRHPLVRSAVLATLGPAELAAAHGRAAAVLVQDGEHGDRVVPHLLAGPPRGDADVVAALRAAAARASGRGAPDVACRYLRRALAEPPTPSVRAAVLLDLGVDAMWSGSSDALDLLTTAAEQADDAVGRAWARLYRARLLFEHGRIPEAVTECERGIEDLGDDAPDLARELEAQLLTAAVQDGRTRAIARRRQDDRAIGTDDGPDTAGECMLRASAAVEEMLRTRSREHALALAESSLRGGHLVEDRTLATLPSALLTLAMCGRPQAARRVWDGVVERRRARGNRFGVAGASVFRGHAAHLAGDVSAAVADLGLGLELAAEVASVMMRTYASGWLVGALVDAGALDEAETTLAAAAVEIDRPLYAANVLLGARGRLRLAQGRHGEAVDDMAALADRLVAWGTSDPAPCPWRTTLALALHGRGDDGAARGESDAAVDAARCWGEPAALAEALRVAGLVTGGERGLVLLDEAVATATGAPLPRARALADLGAARRRRGERVTAREPLRLAVDLALAQGADGLARRARDELVASGARPRRLRRSGTEALTPTETRVAALAAEGATSRAVAQALFVSEKTVETHLGSIYRKLGIAARAQLRDALAGSSVSAAEPATTTGT